MKNPQIFWSTGGEFIFTGSEISTFSGAENFFHEKKSVTDVKVLKSDIGSPVRYYIEYPNFSDLQNIEILSRIRKKMLTIAENEDPAREKPIGYHATFFLTEGKNIGTIVYSIFRDDTTTTEEISRETILLDEK